MDETGRAFLTAVLPPFLTALLATLTLWLTERRKDRNADDRRRKLLAEENDRITYLKSWLEAELMVGGTGNDEIGTARTEVLSELAQSWTRLSNASLRSPNRPAALARALRKVALVPMARPAAQAVRALYWFMLALGLCLWSFVITTDFSEVRAIDATLSDAIYFSLMVLVPFLVVAWLLAQWAGRLEARGSKPRAGVPSPREESSAAQSLPQDRTTSAEPGPAEPSPADP